MKKIPYSGPHTLYHYTSLDGIRGILSSRGLWVSDVRFMNDKSEYQYAVNMMVEKLRGIAFRVPPKYVKELEAMEKRVHTLSGTVFAFCLTAAEDRLSQWRGYSQECSLGFNGRLLHENAIRKGFSLKPVVYAEHHQTELLNMIEYDAGVRSRIKPDEIDTIKLAREYAKLFLDVAPFIKHWSFFEEEEWRLAVHRVRNDKRKVHFRERRGKRIGYLVMPLTNPRRLFSEIIVGPAKKQKQLMAEAEKLCEEYGLKIPVGASSSPYRSI